MTATGSTSAATAQRRQNASIRRRARRAMVTAGLTPDEVATAMSTSPSAVRQALLRDTQLENARANGDSPDDGLIWEASPQ